MIEHNLPITSHNYENEYTLREFDKSKYFIIADYCGIDGVFCSISCFINGKYMGVYEDGDKIYLDEDQNLLTIEGRSIYDLKKDDLPLGMFIKDKITKEISSQIIKESLNCLRER